MAQDKGPNDFRPQGGDAKPGDARGKAPRVHAFVRPELEVHIDERELKQDDGVVLVCRCDSVCTCNTVNTDQKRCRCDTVARCTCETVQACTCNTVMVCRCDSVRTCTCQAVCGCDRHSPGGGGGGGGRTCRCVPVRAH